MVNFNTWMQQNNSSLDESHRAIRAWNLILRNPTEITVLRGSSEVLDPQQVRIEYSNTEREIDGSSAKGAKRDVIIFGVKNHPDEDVLDTDIKRGDLFELNTQDFRVEEVMVVPGGIQVTAKATT